MQTFESDIIYGIHPVEELLRTRPESIHRLYFAQQTRSGELFALMKQCRKDRIPYQLVPAGKLTALAASTKHQGIVAQCGLKQFADAERILADLHESATPGLLLIPASIEDPRNLGAIIRSAVAFGVSAVFMERKHCVHLGATVAKTSAGMLEHIAVARPRSLEAVLKECKKMGYQIIGALPGASLRPRDIDFTNPTVLVIGGEHRGIPPYLRALCTDFVSIPTASKVQSLNAAAAASILLYECGRQRADTT